MVKNVDTIRNFDSPAGLLDGKSVLVTGGTGSFGHAFVRHVLTHYKPRKLIVFSRDEFKQSEMALAFPVEAHPSIRFFIGDVREQRRLEMAMRGVDIVIHAAAMKQVPAAEYNPFECVHTNIIGAENVVQAAIGAGVKQVVALSTDKAANPVNLYGATKLASDKIFVAANHMSGRDGARFSVVRYGNVIGSRGSVVPFFKKLVADGAADVPITDPRMTRFFITLEQGVNFVLSSLSVMLGGEIFVPKIPSVRITDLAEALAPGLPHRIVGVRPGEKLHEVMITVDDSRSTLETDDRYIIKPFFDLWTDDQIRLKNVRPVEDGLSYASDSNDEWLTQDALKRLCA